MITSRRLSDVPPSPIRKLVPLAQAAKKKGVMVYHLNIGDPDIKTPDQMIEVLKTWKKNPIRYDQSQGNPDLLDALLWYYKKIGFSFLKHEHIQVTLGGSEGIFMSLFAVGSPGDELIVFEPFFTTYNSYAVLTGVKVVPVRTSIKNGFHLPSRRVIEKKITKKTKAILYTNPNNPTGTVYRKAEIETLVTLAKKHNLFLIADEVYREFCYDGRKHVSLFSYMRDIPDRAILLDSLSKRYALCGARLGMLISLNPDVMAGVLRIAQARLSAGLIDQTMAAALTKVPDDYFKAVQREYALRRDLLYEGLRKIGGVTIPKPEGAFYTVVGLPIADAEHFCAWLLTDFRENNETIMLAPAPGFYATKGLGKNEVRIAYVINQKGLRRCIELICKALAQYN